MRVVVFDQWDRLAALIRGVAAGSATDRARYDIVRVEPRDGRAQLSDRAVNCLAVDGGRTTVAMPRSEGAHV